MDSKVCNGSYCRQFWSDGNEKLSTGQLNIRPADGSTHYCVGSVFWIVGGDFSLKQKIIWCIQLIINCAFMLYFAAKLSNFFFIDNGLSIIITILLTLAALIIAYVLTLQFKNTRR